MATLIGDDAIKTGLHHARRRRRLQALLAVMRERGATNVAMEVSSHALAMGRVGGIEFAVGAFTNLSEDHLDFHADMEEYFRAKAMLFDRVDDRGRRHRRRVGTADGRPRRRRTSR